MQITSVSFTSHGITHSLTAPVTDLRCGEVVEGFVRPLLRAAGYAEQTINDSIGSADEDMLDSFAKAVEAFSGD